jgi:hypothetical protein
MAWFAGLYDAFVGGSWPLGSFAWGDFWGVLWNALVLFLPLIAIMAVALWGIALVFGRGGE